MTSFLLSLTLISQTPLLRFTDIVGTTASKQECSTQALKYLNNKRAVNKSIRVDKNDYYEWVKFSGDCSAVYFEVLR